MAVSLIEALPDRSFVDGDQILTAKKAAQHGIEAARRFIEDPKNAAEVERAIRIRAVENALYDLFGKGKLHGTIHTCIGQEFCGAILGKNIQPNDYVTSNHRCHGHFIGATGDWQGLVDELIGNKNGVCAGIGSSQHLWAKNFMSNGQQGGLLPVAAGVALDRKGWADRGAVVSFIGEGTLGEGIVYETMNLDALWDLPHIIVCENNFYSQSTAQAFSVAGSIGDRAASFGVTVAHANTWDLPALDRAFRAALDRARNDCRPTFLVVATYRLNPHSKGDDQRNKEEIEWFAARDPTRLAIENFAHFASKSREIVAEVAEYATLALEKSRLEPAQYFLDQRPTFSGQADGAWKRVESDAGSDLRQVQQLNIYYRDCLVADKAAYFIGEDIADPYGGAFKVAKGLSTAFPAQVRTTPISEAAIVGIGIGLAICGHRSFVEIMFGDFITYAFDQIINNASKFFHMYNRRVDCPVVIRAAMGGRRGYGPTHSQSLERFLIGIDNCCTLSLNSLAPPALQLGAIASLQCPVILLENKIDYAAKTYAAPDGVTVEVDDATFPTLRIAFSNAMPTVTVIAYGGMARFIADQIIPIFETSDTVFDLIVPVGLSPLNLAPILESVQATGQVVIVEEGAGFGSVGAEIIAQLQDKDIAFKARRIGGKEAPIPSPPHLEAAALPSIADICDVLIAFGRATA